MSGIKYTLLDIEETFYAYIFSIMHIVMQSLKTKKEEETNGNV